MKQKREFEGIWIPREIWLNEELGALDKVILAEITSLDRNEEHCYAGNDYLAKFCQCSENKVSKSISKLKKLGYIKQIGFDGRKRTLTSAYSVCNRESLINVLTSLLQNKEQTCKKYNAEYDKIQVDNIYNNISDIKSDKIENNIKEDINNNTTTTTSNNNIYSGGCQNTNNSDSNIYEYIEKNFGRPLSPIEYQKINKWEDSELTRYAVEVAVLNNIHKISYIEGILRNFKDNDIHTVSEAKEFDKKLHKKRNIKTEFIPFVYRDNGLWVYKDENGKSMFCDKPYLTDDGEWKFKNGYGKELKCGVNIDDFKEK